MALAKPPKSPIDRRAEALIDKASAVHSSKGMNSARGREESHVEVPVTVRIPKPMLSDIEFLVKTRPIKTARHTWLMEAIYEKWKRETGGQG
jgi:hypothetical protein